MSCQIDSKKTANGNVLRKIREQSRLDDKVGGRRKERRGRQIGKIKEKKKSGLPTQFCGCSDKTVYHMYYGAMSYLRHSMVPKN